MSGGYIGTYLASSIEFPDRNDDRLSISNEHMHVRGREAALLMKRRSALYIIRNCLSLLLFVDEFFSRRVCD